MLHRSRRSPGPPPPGESVGIPTCDTLYTSTYRRSDGKVPAPAEITERRYYKSPIEDSMQQGNEEYWSSISNNTVERATEMTRGKTTAIMVRERKRSKRGNGTASTKTSGPGDERGWGAGGPPPEPDAWGCKQLPCASYEEVV